MLLDLEVALVEEEDTARAVAVTPGAPGLLQVALERGRRLVVDDVADVRLVDAETEGAGRHHDDPLALLHEARLVLGALLVGHLAMVAGTWDLDQAEPEPDVLDHLGGGAVDDAGARQAARELGELAELLVAAETPHREHEVVAGRRGGDPLPAAGAPGGAGVVAPRRRRRRRPRPHPARPP